MEAADALGPLAVPFAAVALVAAVVLNDLVAYDRRARGHAGRHGWRRHRVVVVADRGRHEGGGEDEPGAATAGEAVTGGAAVAVLAPESSDLDVLGNADLAAPGGAVVESGAGAAPEAVDDEPVAADAEREDEDADADESMLAAFAATEQDERSVLRRIFSAVLLLTLTLLTAGLIGAGIYRGLQGIAEK